MVTVAVESIGCKVNQAETESLARQFSRAGYRLVSPDDGAQIYVLNTCTVTHVADRKCRRLLRLAHRRNPGALVVATGCYAQRAAAELRQIGGVDLIIGNEAKGQLVDIIGTAKDSANPRHLYGETEPQVGPIPRTRALIKIADGCNQSCAYCIVPQTRGRERSVPLEQVISQVRARVDEGYQEVVLTGPQIGSYGRDLEGASLETLVERILVETGVPRLRLSSLQPQDLSLPFIKLWSHRRLCRHLHLPLQSGSDPVLRRMRRRYLTAHYEGVVSLIRGLVPDMAITTDVIVGFPGESEAEFEASYRFCQRMGFARLHVFPFSVRPGTVAAQMPDQVDEPVKKARLERMLELARRSAHEFRQRFLGQTMLVLWETKKDDLWGGVTDNYLRVLLHSDQPLQNRLVPVRLIGEHRDGFWGEFNK